MSLHAWVNPWSLVVGPAVLGALVSARRHGRAGAVGVAGWLLLQFAGCYLMLRFRPALLVLGVPATVAALWLAWSGEATGATPSPARTGGLGLTGFGALGRDRYGSLSWR